MAISDKTRKMLWARSGNRCAMCQHLLIEDATPHDAASVVGDECHIHAQNPGGPRYNDLLDPGKVDDYENLILLCRTHHKQVDDQWLTFPTRRLRDMKRTHEQWVRDTLEPRKPRDQSIAFAVQLATGKDVADLLTSAHHAYDFDHDPVETEEEADLVGGFLQSVRDWGEIWGELEPIEQVKATLTLSADIKGLEEAGFLVFGAKRGHVVQVEGKRFSLPTSVIRVLRKNNTLITENKVEK